MVRRWNGSPDAAAHRRRNQLTYSEGFLAYELFLFDLDDTLLDFKASERLSFTSAMGALGLQPEPSLYATYQTENRALWDLFERGGITKDELKVERFRRAFSKLGIGADPAQASELYLTQLPLTVVLIEGAVEICQYLNTKGELGIITNGIHHTQTERIKNSALAPYFSFVCVSDECGFAKPDRRFFEYTASRARKFVPASTLVVGDRLEADILGAKNFGVDSCWFNPAGLPVPAGAHPPKFEIRKLEELRVIVP